MKRTFSGRAAAVSTLLLLFALTGCREVVTVDRLYQRVLINDFSAPVRTLLPPVGYQPYSITIRVSGTVSQPVLLAVDLLAPGRGRSRVRRDTLAAGTYTGKTFKGDYYSKEETELVVTGSPGASGSLTIEWYR